MSSTPLIEQESYTVDRAWHDDRRIYREIEGKFQDVAITRRMEWEKETGKLYRDYITLKRDGDTWESVQIDTHNTEFMGAVKKYVIRLQSTGELTLDVASRKMDMFAIGLAHAKELQRRFTAGELTPPTIHESTDYWTDLTTGKHHKRGGA